MINPARRPPHPSSRQASAHRETAAPDAGAGTRRSAAAGTVVLAVVVGVLVLTVVGGTLSVLQLSSPAAPGGLGTGQPGGPRLMTSYGSVTVGAVGLSTAPPAGSGPHAAHGAVEEMAQASRLHVPVTLQNDGASSVRYAPEQFSLLAGTSEAVAPQDGPLLEGRLRPGAAVTLRLTFAVQGGMTAARLVMGGAQPADGADLDLPRTRTAAEAPPAQRAPAPPAQDDPPARHDDPSHGSHRH